MSARVLCVEDNPQNMRLVRKILTTAGYVVLEAVDGQSGMDAALRERPSLILMDVNLPDIDGLEAAAKLKNMPEIAATPIVALTANAMHGDRERCIAAGCNGYIPKPITKNELLNTVAHFLNHQADAAPAPLPENILSTPTLPAPTSPTAPASGTATPSHVTLAAHAAPTPLSPPASDAPAAAEAPVGVPAELGAKKTQ